MAKTFDELRAVAARQVEQIDIDLDMGVTAMVVADVLFSWLAKNTTPVQQAEIADQLCKALSIP